MSAALIRHDFTPADAAVRRLREQLDIAEETIAQLRAVVAGTEEWRPPLSWRLTPAEAAILGVLAHRQFVTRDAILVAIKRDVLKDDPDVKICDVFICKLRKKLQRHGIEIDTVYGEGWHVDPATRARLKRLTIDGDPSEESAPPPAPVRTAAEPEPQLFRPRRLTAVERRAVRGFLSVGYSVGHVASITGLPWSLVRKERPA